MAEGIENTPEAIASEATMASNLGRLQAQQATALTRDGQYELVKESESGAGGISMHEYKGGPVGQGPGFIRIQRIRVNGSEYQKRTDEGLSGRTIDWMLIDNV